MLDYRKADGVYTVDNVLFLLRSTNVYNVVEINFNIAFHFYSMEGNLFWIGYQEMDKGAARAAPFTHGNALSRTT